MMSDWENYTFRYTSIPPRELFHKMRQAFREIKFRPPLANPNLLSDKCLISLESLEEKINALHGCS